MFLTKDYYLLIYIFFPLCTLVLMSRLGFTSPFHLQAAKTRFQVSLSETRGASVSYVQKKHPRAMLGWLRELVGGQSANSTGEDIRSDLKHAVLKTPLLPPDGSWAPPLEQATFGLGCFWGAERKFWQTNGVYTTSVGYSGGSTTNPSYRQVCSGRTGHAEVVNVVFDSTKTSYENMLNVFWETHDPTTLNRQGNDVGSQYRSAIYYYSDEQKRLAEATRDHFNDILKAENRPTCTTEIKPISEYYLAEEYHQQYLEKNPYGYCGLAGTGLYRARDSPK